MSIQQFLKPATRIAGTQVIATELLDQLFFTVHHAMAALYAGFGWEALTALSNNLKSPPNTRIQFPSSWDTYLSTDEIHAYLTIPVHEPFPPNLSRDVIG